MAVIKKRFGDEYSTLLDEFERKSFEAHMNRTLLFGRSLSEPGTIMPRSSQPSSSILISMAPIPLVNQVMQRPSSHGRAPSTFQKVLKKLLKPILGRKRSGRKHVSDSNHKDLLFCNDFSRSLRF